MTKETRAFPSEVIVSLSTGTLLCNFSDMHKAAEYLMGHLIWTHHFADKKLRQSIRKAIVTQHPSVPTTAIAGVTPDNVGEKVAALHLMLGATMLIEKGDGSTAKSPI
jgi:thiamine monophosphate synthase